MRVHARRRQTYPHVSTVNVCRVSSGMDGRGRGMSCRRIRTSAWARTFSHGLTHDARPVTHTCTHIQTQTPVGPSFPSWYCISFPFDAGFVFGCRGSAATEESDIGQAVGGWGATLLFHYGLFILKDCSFDDQKDFIQ